MLKHGFLSVAGEQPAGFLHHAIQRCDIVDVVAVDCMDGYAKLQRNAQGIDADQIATMDGGLRAASLCRQNRRRQ